MAGRVLFHGLVLEIKLVPICDPTLSSTSKAGLEGKKERVNKAPYK